MSDRVSLSAAERAQIIFDAISLAPNGTGLVKPPLIQFEATIHVSVGGRAVGISALPAQSEGSHRAVGISALPALSEGSHPVVSKVSGLAQAQTEIASGDLIVSMLGACWLNSETESYIVTDGGNTVTLTLERQHVATGDFVYRIGNRIVCKDIFQHRYPVSATQIFCVSSTDIVFATQTVFAQKVIGHRLQLIGYRL